MAAFVDGAPTGSGQQEQHIDMGPLVGRKRGFKKKEWIPFSGGMVGMVICSDNEALPRQSLPASPSSNERSVKGKGWAIYGDGDIEMAEAHHKSVCKYAFLAFFLFFFQTFFWLDDQAAATIPHKLQTLLYSLLNRLKSHPIFDLRPSDPGGSHQHVSYDQPIKYRWYAPLNAQKVNASRAKIITRA